MNYDNKVWIEGHGLWYQGLASISPRFEFDAIGGLGLKGQPAKPSVVFAAMTVRQTTPNSAATPGGSSSVSALATPDEDCKLKLHIYLDVSRDSDTFINWYELWVPAIHNQASQ